MRTIRFRAKDKRGDWRYGMITYANFNQGVEKAIAIKNNLGSIFIERIDQNTIGQFTGLTDKNGVEIYEGDIVKWTRKNMNEPSCSFHHKDLISLHKIYWNIEQMAFWQDHYDIGAQRIIGNGNIIFIDNRAEQSYIEVIGNIHDNPDLVEKELLQ